MGSKYDDDISNGDSNKGNDTSLIVNVDDTQSDIDESNYSESEIHKSSKKMNSKKSNRNGDSSRKSPHKEKESKSRSKVDVSKTRYLWVSGIPEGTKTSQLEELFLQHGKVLAIKIIRGGSDSTLLGFVKLETVEQAQKCMEKLHRVEFRGNKIELLKERPITDKDGKKPEKIGFRDTRKPFIARAVPTRPHFRPPHSSPRGPFRPLLKPLHASHREHSRIAPDFRRQEREELLKLERERERVKLERMKLERDKAELMKIERESRVFDRERFHDDKRVRSLVKRPFEEPYVEEKRYDEYSRGREEFSGARRYESRGGSPDRKVSSGRSFSSRKYEDSSRTERFSEKYDSGSKWSALPDSSWTGGAAGDSHRWQSTNYDSARILSSSIGSSSIPRLHSGSEISQGISRSYFSNNRRY